MNARAWLSLAVMLVVASMALVVYDRTGTCDVGPVTRAIKDALGQTYTVRCAG